VVIAIDFDDSIVSAVRSYEDLSTPLIFKVNAKYGLLSLKKAGHTLILWSARASPVLLEDPSLDPLVKWGAKKLDLERWEKMVSVHRARYQQMLDFVARELPSVFDAIDDGHAGKLPGVDMFVDDKALRLGYGTGGFGWAAIAQVFGLPYYPPLEAAG
jgi:hypothetical protein